MSLGAKTTGPIRWLWRSSTLRLTLLLSIIFAIGMAVAIVLALQFGRQAVLQRVDTSLASLASAVAADEAPEDAQSIIIRPLADPGNLPQTFLRVAERGGGTVELGEDYRRFDVWRTMLAEDRTGAPVLIAVPLEDSEDALELLGNVLWATAAVVLVFVLAIGLGAGLLAQRRLGQMAHMLDQLAAGALDARTGVSRSKDDMDDLARKLDVTAGELERLVTQTRHLSASLAHDLRTPLARLRARLEALPDGEARGHTLEEAERLSGIFDTIMRVARIEAMQGSEGFIEIDLSTLVDELVEIFGPVVEDAGKTLDVAKDEIATVFADRDMIIQAMANLIQNALVHGGSQITLFANGSSIGVADTGAGVDPDRYEDIVKPMVRLDAARNSDGTGLGLALVRAVADRHAAQLVLSPNQPQGLRVALKFTDL